MWETGAELPAASVPVGSRILVRPGAAVPIDGTVAGGSSVIDEGLLTGEAAPVAKIVGDAVHAGTLNVGSSPLEVLAGPTLCRVPPTPLNEWHFVFHSHRFLA